jgi:hypothetical protein
MSRLLERTVDYLANRVDRRSFIGKTAVVGSAIVAAPLDFGLRPRTAYAAVCNCNGSSCRCGSLCCDGYTEFCCTLTGANTCPPGTVTAGWWKVDGSQFCGGAARYYLDCNAQCGSCTCGSNGVCSGSCSGTRCGCAKGSCNNRKAGCTRFRYGQCNQQIRCVGPIVCRVVTCKPPWQFDPACGTSSRTDNATRYHDRPCLNEPFGNLDSARDVGGAIRVRGWSVDNSDYAQSTVRIFLDGNLVRETTANLSRPDVAWAYPAFGPNRGFDLQIPTTPGRHTICVYALDRRNGRGAFIGFREVVVAPAEGRIEQVTDLGGGKVRVVGWALDPSNRSAPTTMRFRVDGRVVLQAPTTQDRPDVVSTRPGAYLRCGFSVVVDAAAGQRNLCVDVVNRFGRAQKLACRNVTVAAMPFGQLESVTDEAPGLVRVRGWVIDPAKGKGPALVRVRVGASITETFEATLARPDVEAEHPTYGQFHGFDRVVAADPGERRVCVDTVHGPATRQLVCRDVVVGE